MNALSYTERSALSDQALDALRGLRDEDHPRGWEHELLGRLCWLAPDAVLEAAALMQARRARREVVRESVPLLRCLAGIELGEGEVVCCGKPRGHDGNHLGDDGERGVSWPDSDPDGWPDDPAIDVLMPESEAVSS